MPAPFLVGFRAAHRQGAAAVGLTLHVGHVQRCRFADPQQRIRHDLYECRIAEAGE